MSSANIWTRLRRGPQRKTYGSPTVRMQHDRYRTRSLGASRCVADRYYRLRTEASSPQTCGQRRGRTRAGTARHPAARTYGGDADSGDARSPYSGHLARHVRRRDSREGGEMSDDTEALTNARAWLTTWPYRDGAYELISVCADTIERLERDRDALAERCEKLREALRNLLGAIETEARAVLAARNAEDNYSSPKR